MNEMGDEKRMIKSSTPVWNLGTGTKEDALNRIGFAMLIIWAGVVLLLENLGFFDALGVEFLLRMQAWEIIFAGAGLLVLLLALVRLASPEFGRLDIRQILFGFFLFGIGIGGIVGWDIVGALILIGLGVGQLLKGLR